MLIKISINANIINTILFIKWSMTSKVTKVILNFQNHLFLRYIICTMPHLLKTFLRMPTHKFFIKWSMTSKVIQGHKRPLLCKNHSSTFIYGSILIKICMNANIMKIQFFHKIIYDQKCHFLLWRSFVIFYFKTFWPNYNWLTFLWTTFGLVLIAV